MESMERGRIGELIILSVDGRDMEDGSGTSRPRPRDVGSERVWRLVLIDS